MRIVDEGFEGVGYEESWTETVSGGNTLDEDSTTVACFGSQSLKAVTTAAAAPSAYATRTFGDVNAVFVRAWVRITENGLTGASEVGSVLIIQNSASSSTVGVQLRNNAGTFQMRFFYYSNGGIVYTNGVNISINTWYLIEFSYDTGKMLWSWYMNGILRGSGHLTGTILTPNKLLAGIAGYTGTAQSTVHLDNVAVDNNYLPAMIDSIDPIILEVPSTTILFNSRIYVKSIRWVGATTAGHTAVITNKNGRTIWASEVAGANFIDESLWESWIDGLSISTLASGKIYIQIG